MCIFISYHDEGSVIFLPYSSGLYGNINEWIKRYGRGLIVPEDKVFETMLEMEEWSYDNFEESINFQIN